MNDKLDILKNFIVFEGLDGSGTTTQLNLVGNMLIEKGYKVFKTCEPSPLPTGKIIRSVLQKNITVEPSTLAIMFSADRNEHLYNKDDGIIKHLKSDELVISDRYLFSSLAYQSLNTNFDFVKSINNFPLPEFLFYIDVSPETCKQRINGRGDIKELFEENSIQMSIINNYKKAINYFSESNMKIITIDGKKQPEQIRSEIISTINR